MQHNRTTLFSKICLIAFAIIAVYIGKVIFFPRQIPNQIYPLIIDEHESLSIVATKLQADGIISNRRLLLIGLHLLHKDRKIEAGLYMLKNSISLWGVIRRISSGNPDAISVTIIDGWNLTELRRYINNLDNIQHLTAHMTDAQLQAALKINLPNLEGVFYPATYFIVPNQADLEIYHQAYQLMQHKLVTLYQNRSISSHYNSPYQMLIMASLIEKETSHPDDMQLISTVFNNRLARNMKLQDDPAVFYGLHNKELIKHRDFAIDTPYNTYLHTGLPPTPICIPSESAIVAASKPENNPKLLYFLAVGGGKTIFSKNYKEDKALQEYYCTHCKVTTTERLFPENRNITVVKVYSVKNSAT